MLSIVFHCLWVFFSWTRAHRNWKLPTRAQVGPYLFRTQLQSLLDYFMFNTRCRWYVGCPTAYLYGTVTVLYSSLATMSSWTKVMKNVESDSIAWPTATFKLWGQENECLSFIVSYFIFDNDLWLSKADIFWLSNKWFEVQWRVCGVWSVSQPLYYY